MTFMKRMTTGDEIRLYEYGVEVSQQSSDWHFEKEPKLKITRQSHSIVKILLTVFLDFRGVVYCCLKKCNTMKESSELKEI